MYLLLKNFKYNTIIIFVLGFIVLSIWEYIVAILLEKIFKTKYWDYSGYKYNFQGRVCLMNSVFWGILGVIFIKYIHPFVELQLSKVDINIIIYIEIIVSLYICCDIVISIITVLKIDKKLKTLKEINLKIKDKLEEIKLIETNVEKSQVNNIEKRIKELNYRNYILKRKLYKQVYRLKEAFPSIKSETFTEVLSLKDELKQKLKKDNKTKE